MLPGLLSFVLLLIPVAQGTEWSWDPSEIDSDGVTPLGRPLIIGHRGASGMYPEHTELAYQKAAEQGADYVECDVVVTKDLVLICSHEPQISEVSNVKKFPEFSQMYSTYVVDDDDPEFDWNDKGEKTDFFTFDFTLEQLLRLKRKQVRRYRDPNYNWQYGFITFDEYVEMAKELKFGIYPEIKHGAATNKIFAERKMNITIEELLVDSLKAHGYESSEDACLIQAFERESLRKVRQLGSQLRLIFLLKRPAKANLQDLTSFKNDLDLYGMGLDKDLLVIKDERNRINRTNADLIEKIHSLGMKVHAYTFRNEPRHLNWNYGQDFTQEYDLYMDMKLDGFFTDFPASLSRYFEVKEKLGQPSFNAYTSDSNSILSSFLMTLLPIIAHF